MSTPARSTKARVARSFTATELLVTIGCIVLLASFFLPALARSKARSSRINCNNNMKQIGLAFQSWSLDNNGHFPMQVTVANAGTMELVSSGAVHPHFAVMSNELSTPKVLVCPMDQERNPATNFTSDLTDGKLSYFINVDAINSDASSILSGDRNLTTRPSPDNRLVCITNATDIAWTKEVHSRKGNVAFSDSRVETINNGAVTTALKIVSGTTNRLAVP